MLHVVILCEIGAILYLHFICDLQHFLNEAWETRLKLKVTSEAWQTQSRADSVSSAFPCSCHRMLYRSQLRSLLPLSPSERHLAHVEWLQASVIVDGCTEQKRSREVGSNAFVIGGEGDIHAAVLHRRNATGDALVLGRLGWQPVSKRGWGGQVAWGVVKHHVPRDLGTCPWGQTCK